MKKWLGLGLAILTAEAAYAANDLSDWTIQPGSRDESQITDVELHYLLFDNQRVRLAKFGAKTDSRFELIGIDQKNRSIWLLASPYENSYAMQRSAGINHCRSIGEPQDRKNFYSICNSRFAIQRGDITEVDTDKFRQTLENAGLVNVLAEGRLVEYRSEFAKATTAGALKRFIERHKENDPEGLVEQARRKLPNQELEDYRAAFNRAIKTPVRQDAGLGDPGFFRKEALRGFINTYSARDLERLTIKANDELTKMLADDEHQRKWHFDTVGKLGTTVCMEVHTDPSLTLDEHHWREAGFAQIVGSSEQATPTKLKVMVHRIMAWKIHNISQNGPLAGLAIDGIRIAPGSPFWADRSAWRVCQTK